MSCNAVRWAWAAPKKTAPESTRPAGNQIYRNSRIHLGGAVNSVEKWSSCRPPICQTQISGHTGDTQPLPMKFQFRLRFLLSDCRTLPITNGRSRQQESEQWPHHQSQFSCRPLRVRWPFFPLRQTAMIQTTQQSNRKQPEILFRLTFDLPPHGSEQNGGPRSGPALDSMSDKIIGLSSLVSALRTVTWPTGTKIQVKRSIFKRPIRSRCAHIGPI